MNNHFLNTTRCTVSTLSPVHIGCGEDYYPTNYVIDNGLLHHFSEEGLLATLTLQEKNALAKIAEEPGDNGIKKLQGFIHSKKDKLQLYATHSVPLSEQLETFYKTRIGQTSQREGKGREVNNQLNIARHAFNPYNQTPYFAGSSIKGSIRTALLNSRNKWDNLKQLFDNLEITDEKGDRVFFNQNKAVPNSANQELQRDLLDYQDFLDDPLRLLKVSDANYQHPDALHGLEVRFAVNRKKQKIGPNQILECLPAHRSRSLTFNITFLEGCNWYPATLAEACNDFFLPQLEVELGLLEELNYANPLWLRGLNTLLKQEIVDALKNNQAFLLRIGQHSGAESHTLENLRHIHIPQIKKYLSKPTSLWLVADHKDQQHDLLPFGWVLVEIGDVRLDKTHDFLTNQAAPDYQRHERIQQLFWQRAEFLAQEQQKQAIKAQQEAEAAEQARLQIEAEQVRAAQMAAMSAEQQMVFELKEAFARDKNPDPNGTLRQTLSSAVKQAENWSAADKQALLEIANTLCSLWGKPKKLKDQLKSLQ